jgi:hypothetical protein
MNDSHFHLDMLRSYDRFKAFFEGKEALVRLTEKSQKPSSVSSTKTSTTSDPVFSGLFYYRWIVTIQRSCFNKITVVFFNTLSSLFSLIKWDHLKVKCRCIAQRFSLSNYQGNPHPINSQKKTSFIGIKHLATSSNYPLPSTYASKCNLKNSILKIADRPDIDPKIKKRTYNGTIYFQYPGMCKGMSLWFVYLYCKTLHLFPSPRECLIAVTEEFKKGAPDQACILQGINVRKGKLINLRINEVATIRENDTETHYIQQLNALPFGVYGLDTKIHSTVYIKLSQDLGFFFDPSDGLMEISSSEQGSQLYPLILRYGKLQKIFSFAKR